MFINEELKKSLNEAKYLVEENAYRYRPIVRGLFERHEKGKSWLSLREIHAELKKHFEFHDYTIEECERDLKALTEWNVLINDQDDASVFTIEEFKSKRYRYQLTPIVKEIERGLAKVEKKKLEGTALKTGYLLDIKEKLKKLKWGKVNLLKNGDKKELHDWWVKIDDNFKTLNQNWYDYINQIDRPNFAKFLYEKEENGEQIDANENKITEQ